MNQWKKTKDQAKPCWGMQVGCFPEIRPKFEESLSTSELVHFDCPWQFYRNMVDTSWLNIEAPRASALSFIDTNLVTKHQNWQFCQSPRHSGPSLFHMDGTLNYIGDPQSTTTAFGPIIEGEMWKMLLSPKTIHRLIRPTKVHPSEIRGISQIFRKKSHFWEGNGPTPTFVGTFATIFLRELNNSSPKHTDRGIIPIEWFS